MKTVAMGNFFPHTNRAITDCLKPFACIDLSVKNSDNVAVFAILWGCMTSERVNIKRQPDEESCGPTCLHAIYQAFGDDISLTEVRAEMEMLETGGTLAPLLASHALRRGYKAKIHSFNVMIFDPTWFDLDTPKLKEKLLAQLKCKRGTKFTIASKAYLEFLELGGRLEFEDLNSALLKQYLSRAHPIIVGLSATYLYKTSRENPLTCASDDVCGEPSGHFVICKRFNERNGMVTLADPYFPNRLSDQSEYNVTSDHLICSMLLGVVTYDANVLVIEK